LPAECVDSIISRGVAGETNVRKEKRYTMPFLNAINEAENETILSEHYSIYAACGNVICFVAPIVSARRFGCHRSAVHFFIKGFSYKTG
jgi:hypothetical protein